MKLTGRYFLFNLSAAMEYRTSFILQTLGMAANDTFFLFFWWVIFRRVPDLGGYGFRDVMSIWAMSAATFGLLHVIFGNVRRMSEMIATGQLDVFLVQPRDPFIHAQIARMDVSAWGDLLYGCILFGALNWQEPLRLMLLPLFVLGGALLTGAVLSMAESLSFWMGHSGPVTRLVLEFFLNFSLYPDSIFSPKVRWLTYTVLPTAFVVFLPYKIMSVFSLPGLAGILAFDTAAVVLAWRFFNRGLRRYASGNLMGTRM